MLPLRLKQGAVAQLVARLVRNEKARGSNPLSSTTLVVSPIIRDYEQDPRTPCRRRGELLRKAIRSYGSLGDDIHCVGAAKSASGILNLEHRRSDVAGVVDDLLIVF